MNRIYEYYRQPQEKKNNIIFVVIVILMFLAAPGIVISIKISPCDPPFIPYRLWNLVLLHALQLIICSLGPLGAAMVCIYGIKKRLVGTPCRFLMCMLLLLFNLFLVCLVVAIIPNYKNPELNHENSEVLITLQKMRDVMNNAHEYAKIHEGWFPPRKNDCAGCNPGSIFDYQEGVCLDKIPRVKRKNVIIFWESGARANYGRVIGRLDGTVEFVREETFALEQGKSQLNLQKEEEKGSGQL